MRCRDAQQAVLFWDPRGRDLSDDVVLHLDQCSHCRAVFEHRFPPHSNEALPTAHCNSASRIQPWLALAALGLLTVLSLPNEPPIQAVSPWDSHAQCDYQPELDDICEQYG